jgi:hypothetical protein
MKRVEINRWALGVTVWMLAVVIAIAAQIIRETRFGFNSVGHEYMIVFWGIFAGTVIGATDWRKVAIRFSRTRKRDYKAIVRASGGRWVLEADRRKRG